MIEQHNSTTSEQSSKERPEYAEVFRMVWLAFGPMGLIFTGAAIWAQPAGTYTRLDIAYAGLLISVLVARFVEIKFYQGRTTDDKPATLVHWWRYSAILVVLAAAAWLVAHSVG